MWKDEYKVGNIEIDKQHELLYGLIWDLADKQNQVRKIKSIDSIFIALVSHFLYENRFMENAGLEKFNKHINEHNRILSDFWDIYIEKCKSNLEYTDVLQIISQALTTHIQTFDKELVETINISPIKDVHEYESVGCISVVFFENGYFLHFNGETDKALIEELKAEVSKIRDKYFIDTRGWIGISDLRTWNFLTYSAMELTKDYADVNSRHNKALGLFITGNKSINDYIVSQFSTDEEKHFMKVYDLHEAVCNIIGHGFSLGKIIKITCIGNIDFVNIHTKEI